VRGKVEVINDVIHERKVLEKAAMDRLRKQLYGVWMNGYVRGKADAEAYLLHCGDDDDQLPEEV